MLDTAKAAMASEAVPLNRRRLHAALLVVYGVMIGVACEITNGVLFWPAAFAAIYSLMRINDYRARWKAVSDQKINLGSGTPDGSSSAAGGQENRPSVDFTGGGRSMFGMPGRVGGES